MFPKPRRSPEPPAELRDLPAMMLPQPPGRPSRPSSSWEFAGRGSGLLVPPRPTGAISHYFGSAITPASNTAGSGSNELALSVGPTPVCRYPPLPQVPTRSKSPVLRSSVRQGFEHGTGPGGGSGTGCLAVYSLPVASPPLVHRRPDPPGTPRSWHRLISPSRPRPRTSLRPRHHVLGRLLRSSSASPSSCAPTLPPGWRSFATRPRSPSSSW